MSTIDSQSFNQTVCIHRHDCQIQLIVVFNGWLYLCSVLSRILGNNKPHQLTSMLNQSARQLQNLRLIGVMFNHRTIIKMPIHAEFLLMPVRNKKQITSVCLSIEKHTRMNNAGIISRPIFGHMVLVNDLVLQNVFQMWFHPRHIYTAAVFKCLEKVRMQLSLIRKQSLIKTLSLFPKVRQHLLRLIHFC